MKILVSGSHGLVGRALLSRLSSEGHEVARLVRSGGGTSEVHWDPESGSIETDRLGGFDGVVHLAGESIAGGRWTAEKKRRIRDSRVKGTALLASSLAATPSPPKVFICASAVGYYGDRGGEELDESKPPGSGFLPEVCVQWESATHPAAERGARVVNLRFGVILSREGGALAQMLPPFRMGAGGPVGSGKQYLSWISLDDAVEGILFALRRDDLRGPVNVVSPQPVTNAGFARALGRAVRRPAVMPLPAFAARIAFGEMADALLLASARVTPAKLQAAGYSFRFPEINGALQLALE